RRSRRGAAGRRSAAAGAWRRNRGCRRCPHGLRAGSPRSHFGRRGKTRAALAPSVRTGVVDVEVVERARRPVAPEGGRVEVVAVGPLEQAAELRHVMLAELLLDTVG